MVSRTPRNGQEALARRRSDRPDRTSDSTDVRNVVPGDQTALTGHFEAFAGPLPHPDHFAAYEQSLTGAADRILTLTEQQSSHRHAQETIELQANIGARTRGQWFAFLVALMSLGIGAYLAVTGSSLFAATVMTVGLAELGLAVYLKLRRALRPDDSQGDPPAPPPPPRHRRDDRK